MHGDYLQHAKYQTKVVSWGVSFFGQGHIIRSGHIGIDVVHLYNKLKDYLQDEISKNDQTTISIEIGVIYKNPKKDIIDEFTKL